MFELGGGGQEVDREDVEADGDAVAVGLGELAEVGGSHAAEGLLLVGIDLGFCGGKVACGAGFDLEEDEGVAIPGGEVEVAAEAVGTPAASDDGVAEGAEVEEGGVFALFAGEEVPGLPGVAVGKAVESGVGAAFEGEDEAGEGHAGRIRFPWICRC